MMNVFSVLSLTCHPAEYLHGDECCPKCPPGVRVHRHCTWHRSTACKYCSAGTFMDEPTDKLECFPCTNCDSGSGLRMKRPCTITSDTVCELLDGFYCLDFEKDSCRTAQKHTSCQPGQYISHNGTALTDTVCTDCSNDTFSNGTFTSCQPHTKCESLNRHLIKAGTSSTDAQCGELSLKTAIIVRSVVVVVLLVALKKEEMVQILSKKLKSVFHDVHLQELESVLR
ncbi:tumor necrosis factor receptor superfamily member 14-like [Scomber japonicus]|uniref:tumor necrosis factor receptor superfamily member 14-like n=1 Tax=Scomber japonicus TaxID=13676 RepID=UPI002305EE82|nr:tumor necrosis factor receptor superfamily member 14-like [Scomber japonicus]